MCRMLTRWPTRLSILVLSTVAAGAGTQPSTSDTVGVRPTLLLWLSESPHSLSGPVGLVETDFHDETFKWKKVRLFERKRVSNNDAALLPDPVSDDWSLDARAAFCRKYPVDLILMGDATIRAERRPIRMAGASLERWRCDVRITARCWRADTGALLWMKTAASDADRSWRDTEQEAVTMVVGRETRRLFQDFVIDEKVRTFLGDYRPPIRTPAPPPSPSAQYTGLLVLAENASLEPDFFVAIRSEDGRVFYDSRKVLLPDTSLLMWAMDRREVERLGLLGHSPLVVRAKSVSAAGKEIVLANEAAQEIARSLGDRLGKDARILIVVGTGNE